MGHRRRGAGDGGVAGGRRDGAGVLVAQDRAGETASGGNGWKRLSSRVDDVKASYYEGGVILEDADAVIDEDAVELPSLEAVPRSIPGLAKAKRFTKIAGPVLFLNSIKVLFVASLVQAVTAISPACSAANGASFFLFPYGRID